MIKFKSVFCCLLAVLMIFGVAGCKSSDTTTSDSTSDSRYDSELFEKYGFSYLDKVELTCVEDFPNGDAVYEIEAILTDMETDVSLVSQISCDVSGVVIDGSTVTVPYDIKKDNSSVTLTAKHGTSGMTIDFDITFEKWELVFEDDFEGDSLDMTKWDYCPTHYRDKGYVNYWNDDMTFVEDGYLVSRAYNSGELDESDRFNNLADPSNRTKYLSGAVWTKDLFENDYGYYEVYAKPHQITGIWGAFWVVAGDMDSDNPADDDVGTNGAEIDIFESLVNFSGVSQTVHWDGWTGVGNSMLFQNYKTEPNIFDGEFHTFALRWSPTEYVFLIDGVVTMRTDAGGVCEEPGYINITSECGTWAGDWVLDVGEYSDMLVDYVRVYTADSDK